jgi:hypothetical protein
MSVALSGVSSRESWLRENAYFTTRKRYRVPSARSNSSKKPVFGKYINTPEIDVFKKPNVLLALDLAKRRSSRKHRDPLPGLGRCDCLLNEGVIGNAGAPQGAAFTALLAGC